jgi:hypothetical protein
VPFRRSAPLRAPLVAGLLAASGWLALGTQGANAALERVAPPGTFDFFAYYRPNAAYAFGRLAAADLPLWNPQQGAGMPFLATVQTGVLYPLNWLHLVLPTQLAFALLAAVHLGLAAFFAAGLARDLGARGASAAAAGLLYALSFWMLGALWSPSTLYCAAWLPGVLWAASRVVDLPSAGRAAALALAFGLQALTGWPYVLLMTGLATALFAAGALVERGLRERRIPFGALLALGAGAVGGGLLAAPQLLSASELLAHSSRALGVLAPEQTVLLPAPHDPRFFVAALLGNGVNDGVPGLLSLPLAVVALALPGSRRARLATLAGVGLFGLLVSFPLHTPLYAWLRELPLFGDFRFPFRWRLLTTLALSVAAGVGLARLEARLPLRGGTALAASVAALALVVLVAVAPLLAAPLRLPRVAAPGRPAAAERVIDFLRAATTEDGGRVFWQHREEIPWLDKIGQTEHLRVIHDLEPLTPADTARLLSFFETGRAVTIDPRDVGKEKGAPGGESYLGAVPFFGRIGLPPEASRARILDLLSVRFVLANEPPAWLGERYRRRVELGTAPFVYENAGALPRAYRATRAEVEPADAQAALERLVAADFEPHERVLLDAPPQELLAVPAAAPPDAGEALVVTDAPERQTVRTRGARAAALVVTDATFPGWTVTVDGAPATLLRANTLFRSVLVPPGEHVVEFTYRPRAFSRGVALALAAVAAFAAALGFSCFGRRAGAR